MKKVQLRPIGREFKLTDTVTIELTGVDFGDPTDAQANKTPVSVKLLYRSRRGGPPTILLPTKDVVFSPAPAGPGLTYAWGSIRPDIASNPALTFVPAKVGFYTVILVGLLTLDASKPKINNPVTYRGVTIRVVA